MADRGGASDGGVGDLHLATMVVNVQDMRRGSTSGAPRWATGCAGRRSTGGSRCWSTPRNGALPISLQLTDSAPGEPFRVQLDLYTDEQERHVERLVGLGARVNGWPYPDDADFVMLCDLDGKEFCVIDHAGL